MKTVLQSILFISLLISTPRAVAISYTFTADTPSVAAVTNTNILLLGTRMDDFDTLIYPVGFNVYFEGINYNGFIVSSNGWIALAPPGLLNVPVYFASALPNNSLASYSGGLPLFAPLWDDDSCNIIQYGVSANVLTVRWSVKWDKSYTGNFTPLMWMTIDGNTGIITFNYSSGLYMTPFSAAASIGIAGICNGGFYSVTPDNIIAASTVSTTTEDSLVNYKPVNAKFVFTPVSIMNWSGTADTLYENGGNWDDCSIPDCGIDAIIGIAASGRMPTVSSNQSVKDLTIQFGATLRIQSPHTLSICGDFNNYGTLIAEPGSSISFIGFGIQNVNGSFTGANAFANLNISKPSGSVRLSNDIDITQNYSSTGVLNFNGTDIKVGGNFTNADYSTTVGMGVSTLEFNGSGNQYYTNTNSNDTMNNVTINKPSGKLYLLGNYSNLIIDSLLKLISGNIVTGPSLEVSVLWAAPNAIQNYSSNSFVNGRLRRRLYFGSIDFPVGDSLVPNQGGLNGYELANISFTSSTVIPDLLVWFNVWSAIPPLGPVGPDTCGTNLATYNNQSLYDNGYWAFQKDAAVFNGAYDLTLFNTGGSNSTGLQFSVATAPLTFNPNIASSWNMIADCFVPSTLTATKRNVFNQPIGGTESFNHLYATAQGLVYSQVAIDEMETVNKISLAPNPAHGETKLLMNSKYSEKIRIRVNTISGQEVSRSDENVKPGENVIPLLTEMEFIPAGIYSVTVYGEKFIRNLKLIIK